MKVLVTGASGMLGSDMVAVFNRDCTVYPATKKDFYITDAIRTKGRILSLRPDVVINCAAFTDVDSSEERTEAAFAINSDGAANIALACQRAGAAMVHISTDYVFDGKKGSPYAETDETNPINVYGRSKLDAEERVRSLCDKLYIIRTQWLYGSDGKNFVHTMLDLAGNDAPVKVVDDQFGAPTYTMDLAEAIRALVETEAYGTYHLTNSGVCSWYEFACEVFSQSGAGKTPEPCKTEDFPRPAARPAYSALENRKWLSLGKEPLRNWREALKDYLSRPKAETPGEETD